MTDRIVTPLTELERDALGELSNVAMARAATSLRQMVQTEVVLSVPSVEIMSPAEAAAAVTKPGVSNLVAVRQDFSGAFSGRALLIFPETTSLELVRAVVGQQLSLEDIVELEDEALTETGNIILNSWISTIANLFKQKLKISLPQIVHHSHQQIFEASGTHPAAVLFLHIKFELRDRQMSGFVALVMDVPSIGELRSLIAEYVKSIDS